MNVFVIVTILLFRSIVIEGNYINTLRSNHFYSLVEQKLLKSSGIYFGNLTRNNGCMGLEGHNILTWYFSGEEYGNIAEKGTPSQIDSHEYGPADKAIDGASASDWSDDFDMFENG